jgi:hypothetical protein
MLAAALASEFAQNLNPTELTVIQISPKLPLQALRTLLEGFVRRLDLQKDYRSKVADDIIDLRMERLAIEQRKIEAETGFLAPAMENVRKCRQQNARRRDAESACGQFEGGPLFGA